MAATQDAQAARWDASRIGYELNALLRAVEGGSSTDAAMVAEEIAARCAALDRYEWDADKQCVAYSSPTGLSVHLRGDVVADEVTLTVEWAQTGVEDRSGLSRNVRDRSSVLSAGLKGRWNVRESTTDGRSFAVVGCVSRSKVMHDLEGYAKSLDDVLGKVAYR